jgi:hypothetical protein
MTMWRIEMKASEAVVCICRQRCTNDALDWEIHTQQPASTPSSMIPQKSKKECSLEPSRTLVSFLSISQLLLFYLHFPRSLQ